MFQYYTSFGINLPSSCGASLICRKVVSIGRAGGRQKVVVGIYQMNLISDSNDEDYLFTPFSLVRYVQCGAGAVDPANPAANCPA